MWIFLKIEVIDKADQELVESKQKRAIFIQSGS